MKAVRGLKLLPLGCEEQGCAIDWIGKCADRPPDLADASLVVAAMSTGIHSRSARASISRR